MKKILITLSITLISVVANSQSVGIGTNNPNNKSALEIRAIKDLENEP